MVIRITGLLRFDDNRPYPGDRQIAVVNHPIPRNHLVGHRQT